MEPTKSSDQVGVKEPSEEGYVLSVSESGRVSLLGGLNSTFGVQICLFHVKK